MSEVNVSCVLFAHQELLEGWQLLLKISFHSNPQEATVGVEELCLAAAGLLFMMCILGFAKHLSLGKFLRVTLFNEFLQPKHKIWCDQYSTANGLLEERLERCFYCCTFVFTPSTYSAF